MNKTKYGSNLCTASGFSIMLTVELGLTEWKVIIIWINYKLINHSSQLGNGYSKHNSYAKNLYTVVQKRIKFNLKGYMKKVF